MHQSMQRLFALANSGQKSPPISGDSAVAAALNISPQTLYNWKQRGVSEGGAIKAAALFGGDAPHILEGTPLVQAPSANSSPRVAHGLSYPTIDTPPLTSWEVVVSIEKMPVIPVDLMVEVPDDALAARGIAKGERLWFKAATSAEPRNVVLIEANGRRYIRRYAEDGQGPFAQALDDAYPSFREFKIVAVMYMRPASSI